MKTDLAIYSRVHSLLKTLSPHKSLCRALKTRQQLPQRDLSLSQQAVPFQTSAFIHHFDLQSKVLHLRRANRVKEEVLVEDRIAAVFDDGAPLLLQLACVAVEL